MKCSVLGVGLFLAAQGCGGRAIDDAGHGGSSVDAGGDVTSGTPSGIYGSSGAGSGGSSGGSSRGSLDGGDGGRCFAAGDSCCCQGDIVTTPSCDADGSLSCGAGFTLHQGTVCACSTPGICCTPGPDAGDGGRCPSDPPSAGQICSPDGEKCHYTVAGQGATDCGCAGGTWQCFSGCSPGTTDITIDPALCAPQLKSTTTCTPFSPICSFTFDVPCWGDAGMPLGELDAGLNQGTAWCRAVAPPDGPSSIQCLGLNLVAGADGGVSLVGVCNGCGA